ncbi:MAG: DUF87 domain-containing protein, partial [Clostridia bacterium]|nr:DUF87 domain-containing protein [Clostridia bacterium]
VLVDRWSPEAAEQGVVNPNVNILGASGGGKSFAAKLLALREYARGARLLILDPEREYRPLARALGGAWINAAGGEGRLNPLEIRPLPPDTDAEPEEGETPLQGRGPLAVHMQRVVLTWLQLYLPGLDDLERATLSQAVLAAYRDHGIGWETDPASVKTWPTVADVYRHVRDAGAERLAVLLEPAVSGAESALWCGQTTLPPAGDVTVVDIRDLVDAQETVRRAQYFALLTWAWDLVRAGQAEGRRTVLLVDEAWLLADPQTPQALAFLRDLSKRIRKYQGSLVIVTQNSVDFLDPAIRRYGEPVVANAATKLFFRQESRDLEALTQLFRLTEAEQALLSGAKRGEALLIAGNSRVRLTTEASDVEARVIAGGGL